MFQRVKRILFFGNNVELPLVLNSLKIKCFFNIQLLLTECEEASLVPTGILVSVANACIEILLFTGPFHFLSLIP